MKLTTKKIRVITMTFEEQQNFMRLMDEARQGHTSHYAESRLSDGSFLGVSLVDKHEPETALRRPAKTTEY